MENEESYHPALTLCSPVRTRRIRISTRLRRLTHTALDCLDSILRDDTAKAADRISAAKLTLDIALKQTQPTDKKDGTLTVVFENLPDGYAE